MSTETLQEMENILKLQKKLHIEEGPASIELRKEVHNRALISRLVYVLTKTLAPLLLPL